MVFNATFNNTSVILRWQVLLEETGRPQVTHGQTLSHNVVLVYPTGFELKS